jgi:UDP-glucose 4-epimerase
MNVDPIAVFSGKRALVTGGLGFIGSNLARQLVELGADVSLVDCLAPDSGGNPFNINGLEERLRVTIADTRDEDQMGRLIRGQDYLFNLAGQGSHAGSMRDPYTDLEINGAAQLSILGLCRKLNPAVRIVYAGTRQVYGCPRYLPVDEDHPLEPVDYNGVSKMAGEWYHKVSHRVYGLRTTSLRMTNVYGPRMRVKDANQTFIGWWFRRALEGDEIQVFGDGKQVRDFNYIDDVVEALLLAAGAPAAEGQVYNLGGDEPVSLLDLADLVVSLNGAGRYHLTDFPPERKQIDIGDYYGDYSRIHADLGWQPKISLREGIACTLAFYRQYREHYW